MIIIGLIIAFILFLIEQAITELTNTIKPIAEYYYKKQRNQL